MANHLPKFLRELSTELEAIDITTIAEPRDAVKPDERVVGVMDDGLKAIYGLRQKTSRETRLLAKRFMKNYKGRKNRSHCLTGRCATLRNVIESGFEKIRLLEMVLWASLRHEFANTAPEDTIGVRLGWKVVVFAGKDDEVDLQAVVVIRTEEGAAQEQLFPFVTPN